MSEDISDIKIFVIKLCKTIFLWLSLIIIILEAVYVIDGENLLSITDAKQFLGIYIFELIPLSYYIQIRKIERTRERRNGQNSCK